MERRGDVDVMMYNLIYTAICISVFIGLFMYVNSYGRGSAFYEDFYSKEIINLINNAKPGMEFKIDITKLAMIAIKNGKPVKDIIYVNNVNNQITVSTRKDTGTSFGYFIYCVFFNVCCYSCCWNSWRACRVFWKRV